MNHVHVGVSCIKVNSNWSIDMMQFHMKFFPEIEPEETEFVAAEESMGEPEESSADAAEKKRSSKRRG